MFSAALLGTARKGGSDWCESAAAAGQQTLRRWARATLPVLGLLMAGATVIASGRALNRPRIANVRSVQAKAPGHKERTQFARAAAAHEAIAKMRSIGKDAALTLVECVRGLVQHDHTATRHTRKTADSFSCLHCGESTTP
eukprot:scaffold26923_cov157-Isochrysis_galbana.AAC.2